MFDSVRLSLARSHEVHPTSRSSRHVHCHSLPVGFLTPQIAWEFFAREKFQSPTTVSRDAADFFNEVTPHKHRYNGQDFVSLPDDSALIHFAACFWIRQCDVQEGDVCRATGRGNRRLRGFDDIRRR